MTIHTKVNVITNEIVSYEMEGEELAKYLEMVEKHNQLLAKEAEAAAAKAALLEKLGITEEEAKLLLS